MANETHTPGSVKLLEAMLTDSQREYLAGNPGMVGTLDSEREYLAGHWVWGEYPSAARELMAINNYTARLKAFMRGTLGLRD